MPLSLRDSQVAGALAGALYDLLPGSGDKAWRGHVTFATVASRVGVGEFWPGGSKEQAIQTMLELTLERRRSMFERLIVEIVRAGVAYRRKRRRPLTIRELDLINGHILELGLRFPELCDGQLRDSLAQSDQDRARAAVERARTDDDIRRSDMTLESDLQTLRLELESLAVSPDRNAAGRQLESLLTRLFGAFGLHSRGAFRVVGEEIDGAFELDHSVYLVEAKWQKEPVSHSQLLVFHGKVGAKSQFTRGVFVALNDVSSEAREAIRVGKRPAFFVLNGHDLMMILAGEMGLVDFLRARRRLLDEQGLVFAPFSSL
jgi:hypothetical protein